MRFIQLRSAPAQNAGPLPASTTTRTLSSFSSSEKVLVRTVISRSSKALRSSGRLSVTRAIPFSTSTFSMARSSHSEDAELGVFDGRVERCGNRKAEQAARIGGVDHAVVPESRARVVGMALALVLLANRRLELVLGFTRWKIPFDGGEDARRLLATHDGDASVGPHPQEARRVG